MDGNGRWAQKRALPRSIGHRFGVESIREIVRESSKIGVEVLTLYAFSTENWKRPQDEVGVLMKLLVDYLRKEVHELDESGVKIMVTGDWQGFSQVVQDAIVDAMEQTKQNTGLVLNLALNYGGRGEIVRAAAQLAREAVEGTLCVEDISQQSFAEKLFTKALPDPDLIIRTSGEMRLSNFMLYQAAYAELYFTDILWPDFDRKAYFTAIRDYQSRGRRFGGL
ncbi:MAG: isoprenyl transferase [Christensenellales bacterium]